MTENAACDCGDCHALDSEGFCPHHKGHLINPGIDLIPEEDRLRFESVLSIIASFMSQIFPNPPANICMTWLSKFKNLGDEYQRLVVNSLVSGPFHELLDKCSTFPEHFETCESFLGSFLTDTVMQFWFADYILEILESSVEIILDSSSPPDVRGTFHRKLISNIAIQAFANPPVGPYCLSKPNFLPRILEICARLTINIHSPNLGIWRKYFMIPDCVAQICRVVFKDLTASTSLLFTPSPSRTALFDFLRRLSFFSSFTRVDSDHPMTNDDLKAMWAISVRYVYCSITQPALVVFESISASKLCFSESRRDQFRGRPSDENVGKLISFIQELISTFNEWDLEHPVTEHSSLQGTFSLNLPLEETFSQLMQSCLNFYDLPLQFVVNRLDNLSLIQLVERPLMTIAALAFGGTPAFDRNGEDLSAILAGTMDGRFSKGMIPNLYSLFAMYLCTESDPTEFVAKAVAAFGCEGAVESTVQICLLCRFFIQLMANFIPAGGLPDLALLRRGLLQMLKEKPVSAEAIPELASSNREISIAQGLLQQVADSFHADGVQMYKLKPEFESEVSPFWVLYSTKKFFGLLSKATRRCLPFSLFPESSLHKNMKWKSSSSFKMN
jgi:hypothetical protein